MARRIVNDGTTLRGSASRIEHDAVHRLARSKGLTLSDFVRTAVSDLAGKMTGKNLQELAEAEAKRGTMEQMELF